VTQVHMCHHAHGVIPQEAAFQLYRPIIARVIPPTSEAAKADIKPEDGEVAAEEGEIEVPKPAAPEPGASTSSSWSRHVRPAVKCS
jgi:hypothetical protein